MELLLEKLLFAACLILSVTIDGTKADTLVTGTVICDQCKDGQRSLFDYPVNGAKVTLSCSDSNDQITMSREETTNWFGSYTMRFDGAPDLGGCSAHVSGSNNREGGSMSCGEGAGPAQNPRLMFRMFDMEMYAVDPLLAQPPQPMQYCSASSNPSPAPILAPPISSPPPPHFNLPPMPQLPPLPPIGPLPPGIFAQASACPSQMWTMPEYECYWRGVNRDTKVAVAFGMVAARRYGTDMTLWYGLKGRGDPYRTLLREGITALLNSYNSIQFSYHPLGVITHMNLALMGSTRDVLHTALHFMRANSGAGNVSCKFTSCN
ncbi:hypothetical protein TSUD_310350 [Trifolium subterraneum]|uniref:Wall-associated receptor kinase galacturonan-binding domain-containing protein n=1 Tax=Trifolium subterraneum TaxID=3900 RepID=A0A2Z6NUC5_TRISU|nr:hypothetical protein TSUD_310350 [Trifolium subterraneum]